MTRAIKVLVRTAAILGFLQFISATSSSTVDLALIAPWSTPDLLVEIAETTAIENEGAYFTLITQMLSLDTTLSSQVLYQESMAHVSRLIGPENLATVKLGLALHTASPRIEAYHQFYRDVRGHDCTVWAQVGSLGEAVCDPRDLPLHWDNAGNVTLLPFDHVLRAPSPTDKTIIVYTTDFSAEFGTFHKILSEAVLTQGINYVIRYKPSSQVPPTPSAPLYLTGYGVELALKNTDYLVIDDRNTTDSHEPRKTSMREKLTGFGKKISETLFDHAEQIPKIEPLAAKEISDLGLKAVQLITKAADPLSSLLHASQDFPKYAAQISRTELLENRVEEVVSANHQIMRAGMNSFWLNGRYIPEDQVDPFFLVRALHHERRLMKTFATLGWDMHQALGILAHPALSKEDMVTSDLTKDIYDVRGTAVLWWNDIEKDVRYKTWSPNVYDVLRPVYPGQMRAIRRNLYNLILIENIASAKALERITNEIQQMIKQGNPVRFGLVPRLDDSASILMAKILDYVVDVYGKARGMAFLAQIQESLSNARLDVATEALVESTFQSFVKSNDPPKHPEKALSFNELLTSRQAHVDTIRSWLKRLDIQKEKNVLFLNGKCIEHSDDENWGSGLLPAINEQTQLLAQSIYKGLLDRKDDIYTFMMTQPHVHSSRNSYITVTESNPLRMLSLPDIDVLLTDLRHLSPLKADANAHLWVVSDLNTVDGLSLALRAITLAQDIDQVQVALIHTEKTGNANVDIVKLSDVLEAQTELSKTREMIEAVLEIHVDEEEGKDIDQQKIFEKGLLANELSKITKIKFERSKTNFEDVLEKSGLVKGSQYLVLNGRIIGPLISHKVFDQSAFELLLDYETKERLKPIEEAIKSFVKDKQSLAESILKMTSVIEAERKNVKPSIFEDNQPTHRSRPYKELNGKHVSFTIGRRENAFLEIGVVVDPLCETAQKWSAILDTLRGIDGIWIEVYLNPEKELKELPIKRFYRYVFDREPHFDADNGTVATPMAYFAKLPVDALYTLGMDTINAWHVTVKEASMDLDNIRLESADSGVSTTYVLERLLIEGHCIDTNTQGAPRGLQFVLSTESKLTTTDTIVMANLGYFQLKAQPGVWNLQLREGRSAEVYELESIGAEGQWKKSGNTLNSVEMTLALTSFEGITVFPVVHKRPGMENEDVLENRASHSTTEKAKGLWSSFKQTFFNGKSGQRTGVDLAPPQADINIFSVASGQLYERFMSIMIASVMKHTNSTVKFWFIENFLSPSFKDFVPEMAKEYGFDYEMVTYKWPSWLRSQKEKQRTIWGYKILFLDVLFPLSLDKVIFVDADQIVRTDMKELVEMDLNGAPYGYTPFCNDRHEMDGFRFWTQGYWKDHLRERPYHISALYVVDLVRFRQLAAGDRLRAQYQQLSSDPNSLANLDQDLPNNMQHSVPIHSLPQEWLWCETWCSDESLEKAKTIDLCNNPLTKEPKLDRARRQLPEWETYDKQVEVLRKRVARKRSNEPGSLKPTLELPGDIEADKEQPIKDEL